jgi:hypothetical protein
MHKMDKKIISLFLVLIVTISMLTGLVGCGASKSGTAKAHQVYGGVAADVKMSKDTQSAGLQASRNIVTATAAEQKAAESSNGNASGSSSSISSTFADTATTTDSLTNAILSERKMIRNANVTVEVDKFDVAYGKLKSIILSIGFVQESNISKEKIYMDGKEKLLTNGVIVIRVDKDKFEEVLSGISGLGLLMNESRTTDDVTDKFFDTESRLRLLRYEESRLDEYLKKITDPDVIFKTESRLTDIRHEIESLTGTLKKMNDLVALSTITINMQEKRPDIIPQAEPKNYWEKITRGFLDSLKGVFNFIGDLMVFLAQALPVLVLLALFVILILYIYRKYIKRKSKVAEVADKTGTNQ